MHLVFDFDGTITQQDTISELVASAIDKLPPSRHHGRQAAWDKAVQDYLADYKQYTANYQPVEAERTSVAQEVRFLAGVKRVEEASLDRVGRSGVFAGLKPDDLYQAGVDAARTGRVVLRDGFKEIVELAGQRGWQTDVVSVNWSSAFIRGVLHPHRIPITANDTSPDGHILGPECLHSRLTSSPDKLQALSHVAAGAQDRVLYFGDSTTDMKCLLDRDGVVVAADEESPLLRTLRRAGVEVPHVGRRQRGRANICWARNFREVLASEMLEE
ncbi:hypothetical protein TOPH_05191 [Tolypocladium ophioglossoides CBS 100239]|uniref:Uncharacterized protein n=1 Tax=Tolypocladium ophioglossoides (strain CBS 100239) TaxID=1163406 RepID=A0A0L0N7T3_TOLOC|nr:hypothetical protein TOPH_05191 [Tolypocladium ophioglossoides CBS 100239]